jgi:hypothetical protein
VNNIPPKLREELASLPYYKRCARRGLLLDHECGADPITGKLIEWEHCFIFGGKQIQEKWAIIPICYKVHRGGELDKEINRWIALNRATNEELKKYSKAIDYIEMRERLNRKYGN